MNGGGNSLAHRVAELEQRCARLGRPLTLQRRAVLEAIFPRTDHPTADEVHRLVSERLPGLSRATVYRALETLVELGLVAKVCHPGVAVRYDPRTCRHHHLICDACGGILDFDDESLDDLPLPKSERFEIQDYSIQFRGLCRTCRRSGTGSPAVSSSMP